MPNFDDEPDGFTVLSVGNSMIPPERDNGRVSDATAQRLSHYLRCIEGSFHSGSTISSDELARTVGVSAAQVRRDLAALGHLGLRGVGYETTGLSTAIRRGLGIDRQWRAVLVGVGHLARALIRYRGFRNQGFEFVGLFDCDPTKIGQTVDELRIHPMHELPEVVKTMKAELGVITVPASAAQRTADEMIQAGIRGLLNFAPSVIHAPENVPILHVDLAIQFEQLTYRVQHLGSEK
jgi:redox-sensing transcriptional repressor